MSRAHHRLSAPCAICPFSYAEGYTLSASRAAGGEPPLLKVQRGDMHLCINSAARAAGGGTAPSGSALAPCARASAATRAAQAGTPRLSFSPVRSARYSLPVAARFSASAWESASGSALVPYALPARARSLTHFSRHPWAGQCGTPARIFYACS